MIGIIVAQTADGVIGLNGGIPWRRVGDQRRFREITLGKTVIMGRNTWESLPAAMRPLPDRRNMVITSRRGIDEVETYPTLPAALTACEGDAWIIGGAQIYEAAMCLADVIDATMVPDVVPDPAAVRFPEVNPRVWEIESKRGHPYNMALEVWKWRRKAGAV